MEFERKPLNKYRVEVRETRFLYTEVYARDQDEAETIAYNRGSQNITLDEPFFKEDECSSDWNIINVRKKECNHFGLISNDLEILDEDLEEDWIDFFTQDGKVVDCNVHKDDQGDINFTFYKTSVDRDGYIRTNTNAPFAHFNLTEYMKKIDPNKEERHHFFLPETCFKGKDGYFSWSADSWLTQHKAKIPDLTNIEFILTASQPKPNEEPFWEFIDFYDQRKKASITRGYETKDYKAYGGKK